MSSTAAPPHACGNGLHIARSPESTDVLARGLHWQLTRCKTHRYALIGPLQASPTNTAVSSRWGASTGNWLALHWRIRVDRVQPLAESLMSSTFRLLAVGVPEPAATAAAWARVSSRSASCGTSRVDHGRGRVMSSVSRVVWEPPGPVCPHRVQVAPRSESHDLTASRHDRAMRDAAALMLVGALRVLPPGSTRYQQLFEIPASLHGSQGCEMQFESSLISAFAPTTPS
jgi:hypothetical protein